MARMNKLKYCFAIFCFSQVVFTNAQNFVLNGDFEVIDCDFPLNNVTNWYNNTDFIQLHHSCITDAGTWGVPFSISGFQYPQSGDGYGEMQPYYDTNDSGLSERSYIKAELSQWLSPDSLYYCSFYVSAIDPETDNLEQVGHTALVGGIGAYFSSDASFNSEDAQYFDADIESPDDFIITDSIGWYKIEGIFQPTDYSQFISIGCFKDEEELDTLHIFDLSDEGLYWSGYFIDNVQVTYADPVYYSLDLGNDTIVCSGSNWQIELNATENFASYLWNTSATSSSINVIEQGIYWVDVTGPQGVFRDSIVITELTTPESFMLEDIELCGYNDSVLVDVQDGFYTYAWNVGGNSDSIYIFPSLDPIYYVVYADHPCLSIIDTLWAFFYPVPEPPVSSDFALCVGDDPPALMAIGSNLLWYESLEQQIGATQPPIITTNESGTLEIFVTQSIDNCESDKMLINVNITSPPTIFLGSDTLICAEAPFSLGNEDWNYSLVWSTSDTSNTIDVFETGFYQLSASNDCGIDEDQIFVEVIPCGTYIYWPTAFTPNGDGINDSFLPVATQATNIQLIIYNRLGDAIFSSTGSLSWDGDYKGAPCGDDSYVFLLQYIDFNNNSHQVTGFVRLLR
jgi:gliding motility-associated-like protein